MSLKLAGSSDDEAARREKEEDAAENDLLKYERLGIDLKWEPQQSEINFPLSRVQKLENLEDCQSIKVLSLVSNLIDKIENLEGCPNLECLELYQNKIKKIENIEHLVKLTNLDLSFNKIKKIENLQTLINLQNLFLSSNRITKIEGLDTLIKLEQLELGSNRIRELENLDKLLSLKQLWLGRNKITDMLLPPLPKLSYLSLQCNRLTWWNPGLFVNCPGLEEVYLSENQLPNPPTEIQQWTNLRVLDLGKNKISSLAIIGQLRNLTELWLNDNEIESLEEVDHLTNLHQLETLYLERNPIQATLGEKEYRAAILKRLPQLSQLDALLAG